MRQALVGISCPLMRTTMPSRQHKLLLTRLPQPASRSGNSSHQISVQNIRTRQFQAGHSSLRPSAGIASIRSASLKRWPVSTSNFTCCLWRVPSQSRTHAKHITRFSTLTPKQTPKAAYYKYYQKVYSALPGVGLSIAVMFLGSYSAEVVGRNLLSLQNLDGANAKSPISGVPMSILIGIAVNNLFRIPDTCRPGLQFATTTLLRAGIICVGAKLSVFDVLKLGSAGFPVVVASISSGLLFVRWFNNFMGLPAKLGSLIAAGTSICGVTAITALAPAIQASSREVTIAVANVVLFGLLGMLTYPYVAHATLPSSEQVGLFLGTAIHDTSQVMGCALTYRQLYDDETALKVAAITKMTRNLFLAAVIPGLAWKHATSASAAALHQNKPLIQRVSSVVPLFVLGFLAMSATRSVGDAMLRDDPKGKCKAFGLFGKEEWQNLATFVSEKLGGNFLLGCAMAAVGLNTNLASLKNVGPKPFAVGFAGALTVATTGFATSQLLGRYLVFKPSE